MSTSPPVDDLPIIDAIEEATGKSFDRAEAVISPNLARPEWVITP